MKLDIDLQWDLMRRFLMKHIDVFGSVVSQWQGLFRQCYALVSTTCFDDNAGHTMLVPFAHCLNHSHKKLTSMFNYNTKLHLDPLFDKSYFSG